MAARPSRCGVLSPADVETVLEIRADDVGAVAAAKTNIGRRAGKNWPRWSRRRRELMAARPVFILTLRAARRQRHSRPAPVTEIRARACGLQDAQNQPRKEGTMTAIEWTNVTWNPSPGARWSRPAARTAMPCARAWRLAHNPVTPQYRDTCAHERSFGLDRQGQSRRAQACRPSALARTPDGVR